MQSRKVEIQGYPVYQCCNNANDILRRKYESLELEEMRLRDEIKERQKRIDEISEEYRCLNKAEVDNVLEYVRCYSRSQSLQLRKIDTLLCHCQNKLNGNIDSTFLHFDNPLEEKDNNESNDN